MFIALSIFLPYFTGLGLLLHSTSPQSLNNIPKTNQEVARFIAINILLGVSLNHLIILLIHDMKISLFVGVVLSVIGFGNTIFITRSSFARYFKLGLVIGSITIGTTVLFLIFIINSPIEWDAQYIWFFHGKMIYYNNGLNQTAGWSNPDYQFSHVDYPKLIAVLAAQFAFFIGYWDDYLPRLSLLTLLVPAILGISSFFTSLKISFIYLYLMVFFSLNVYTTNGYMDAYLAIYACISLLFFWRGGESNNSEDILAGFAYVSIIPLLKNEGIIYLVSTILSLIFLLTIYKNKFYILLTLVRIKIFWYIVALLLLNVIIWSWIKYNWGLENDLNLGINSIRLIINRINDGSIYIILKHILSYTNIGISLFILLLTIFLSIRSHVFNLNNIILCSSVTIIYFLAIILIYMSTPYDLQWHLTFSIYRTMMTINLSIIAATYITLTTIDKT